MFSILLAQLGGLITEAVLYGIYLVTLAYSLVSFAVRHGAPSYTRITRFVLVVITLLIGFSATLNLALSSQRMVEALSCSTEIPEKDLKALNFAANQQAFWENALRVS